MKHLLLAATALVGLVGAASAADLPRRAVAPEPAPFVAPPAFTWTGFYLGANAGAAVAGDYRVGIVDPVAPVGAGLSVGGYTVGGQVGYNYQFTPGSGIVVGVEGDVAFSDIHNRAGIDVPGFGGGTLVAKTDGLFATARGRVGYAFDRFMVYGTGGYAYTDATIGLGAYNGLGAGVLYGKSTYGLDGYVVGGGIEAALFGNWTAKAEYQYADFDAKVGRFVSTAGTAPVAAKLDVHLLKVGVNYKFNGLFGY